MPPTAENMEALTKIASQVEAAIESYVGVRQDTDKTEWQEHFQLELVSCH